MENKRFEEENAELKAENKDRKIQKSFLQERIEHIRKKMIIFWYGFKVQNLLKQSLCV